MKTCETCSGTGYEYVWSHSPATVIRCTECDGAGTVAVADTEEAA